MTISSFEMFVPGGEKGGAPDMAPSFWFILRGSDLLVSQERDSIDLPFLPDVASLGLSEGRSHLIGTVAGSGCRVLGVPPGTPAPRGWEFEGVRSLFGSISESFFAAAARALEISEWDRTHRFCGSCGGPTRLKPGEWALECTACGHASYPRISPAVIVAVVRERSILLARARRFPPGLYSVLAGYVEPGETLEQCVVREVREETGIEVKNLRYFASQPWPFPHSLMVAFTAEHSAGEIRVDTDEIVDAGWYSAEELPRLPDPISVARRLIDWFAVDAGQGSIQ